MKTTGKFLLTTLIIGTASTLLLAQDNRPPRSGGQRPQSGQNEQGGPGGGQHQGGPGGDRPKMPLIEALDANHDHTIDATEMANATAALKKLDKNGDGK